MPHSLVIVVSDHVRDQLEPFADWGETNDANAKFDWYEVGGRFNGYLKLKAPRRRGFVARLFGAGFMMHVNRAKKSEVDIEQIQKNIPAAILKDGIWHEGPFDHGPEVNAKWRDDFLAVFDTVADDDLLTAVDCHS